MGKWGEQVGERSLPQTRRRGVAEWDSSWGERGGTLFREYHDNGSSPRACFIKKRPRSLPSFSQLLWGLVVVWSECASEWDTVLRATQHSCPRHAHKCVGAGWKQIFSSTHTQKHIDCDFIWRILLVPMSREHFPPKAASTVVLLFSWTLILSVLYIHHSTPLLNNWIYFISLGRWKETQSGTSFQPYSAETQSSLCYCCGDISQQWLYYYPGYESRSNFSLCQLQFAYFAMSSVQATPTIVKISNDATLDWHTKLSNINLKF